MSGVSAEGDDPTLIPSSGTPSDAGEDRGPAAAAPGGNNGGPTSGASVESGDCLHSISSTLLLPFDCLHSVASIRFLRSKYVATTYIKYRI